MNRPALCSTIFAAGLLLVGSPALGQGTFKNNKAQSSSNSVQSSSSNNRSWSTPGAPPRATSSAQSLRSNDASRYDNGRATNSNSRSSAHTSKNKAADPPASKSKPKSSDSVTTKTKSKDTDSVSTKNKSKSPDSATTKTKKKDADSPAKTKSKDADSLATKKPKSGDSGAHKNKGKGDDAVAKHNGSTREARNGKEKNVARGSAEGRSSKIPLGQSTKDQLVKASQEKYPGKRPGNSDTLLKAASGSRLSQSEVDRLIDIRNDPKVSPKMRGAIDTAIIQNQKQALLQAAAGGPTPGGTPLVSGTPAGNQGNVKPFLGGMVVGSILQGFMNSGLLSGGLSGGAGLGGADMLAQSGGFDPGGFDPVPLPLTGEGDDEPEDP